MALLFSWSHLSKCVNSKTGKLSPLCLPLMTDTPAADRSEPEAGAPAPTAAAASQVAVHAHEEQHHQEEQEGSFGAEHKHLECTRWETLNSAMHGPNSRPKHKTETQLGTTPATWYWHRRCAADCSGSPYRLELKTNPRSLKFYNHGEGSY